MSQDMSVTACAMLDDLHHRLQRLEFFLSGSDDPQQTLEASIAKGRDHTITARLANLERTLSSMSEQSPVIHDLLQLRESTSQPRVTMKDC